MENGGKTVAKDLLAIITGDSRVGLETLSALVVVLSGLAFAQVFVVPLNFFNDWPALILYLAGPAILGMAKIILASTDRLTYADASRHKYARAFQTHWPSKHLASKFGLSDEDATYYWFEGLFNSWRDEEHPRHGQWKRTLRRGYACRFVYHCIVLSRILLLLSIVLVALSALAKTFPDVPPLRIFVVDNGLTERIGFTMALGVTYATLSLMNRTSPENLTGVWRRFAEINQMHIRWIDDNVPSLEDLKSRVSSIEPSQSAPAENDTSRK